MHGMAVTVTQLQLRTARRVEVEAALTLTAGKLCQTVSEILEVSSIVYALL